MRDHINLSKSVKISFYTVFSTVGNALWLSLSPLLTMSSLLFSSIVVIEFSVIDHHKLTLNSLFLRICGVACRSHQGRGGRGRVLPGVLRVGVPGRRR